MCLYFLYNMSEMFLVLRRIQRLMTKNIHIGLHVKYPLFLSDFNATRNFSTDFRKILKYEISRKPIQLEPSCSKRIDGHMMKLIIAFRSFAKAPNNSTSQRSCSSTNYSPYQHKVLFHKFIKRARKNV
jgi:hypothetical protein